MILRRFMRHVSDQNWVAVGLDFLIVVIGVVVGFQLNGQYEDARRRAAEHDYLDGIATDFRIYEGLLVCRTDSEAWIAGGLDTLIDALDGAPLDADGRARALAALNMSHVAQTGFLLEGNTSALVGGDLVATIADRELRGLILAAQSISTVSASAMEQLNIHYAAVPRFDAYLERTRIPGIGFYTVTDIDLEGMRADPAVRDRLITLANLHRATLMSDQRLMGSVEAVLDRLVELDAVPAPREPARCPYGDVAAAAVATPG